MCGSEWIGYLEHKDEKALGVFTANVGQGNYTVFAEMLKIRGEGDFQGLPWCAIFVYAIVGPKLGKASASTYVLMKQCKKNGIFQGPDYVPKCGDIIFIDGDGKGKVSHCALVESVSDGKVTSIDGNTIDLSGHFPKEYGGAVARRVRDQNDPRIIGYGDVGGLS